MLDEEEPKFPRQQAIETVLEAVAPLGEEYVNGLRNGLTSERWVDWVENENKRGGAYNWGSYLTNPFILMNTEGKTLTLDEMFTLAHEGGHAMHGWHTKKHQPFPYGHYTLFAAEMA